MQLNMDGLKLTAADCMKWKDNLVGDHDLCPFRRWNRQEMSLRAQNFGLTQM